MEVKSIDNGLFKEAAFPLLVLLVTLVFAASASATTIYVNASNTGTEDGTTPATGWSTIQEGVNNASTGYTVQVLEGTYIENIDVNKGVNIISYSGPLVTIVNASNSSKHVFNVTADNVNISGFTIKDATDIGYGGIFLNGANNSNISNNNLTNNDAGIYLLSSSNNIIANSIASNNFYGIYLYFSSDNQITNNTLNSNTNAGIYLSSSSNNTISSNDVNSNIWYGILMLSSGNNIIANNRAGLSSVGIYLFSSSSNTITNNTASSNYFDGIYLDYSSSNIITNNTVSHNGDGIYLYESSNIDIINNTIYNNTGPRGVYNDGIRGDDNSNNIRIENNEIFNNSYGIDLDASTDTTFNNFTIINNNVYSNGYNGLWVEYLLNSTIANNNVSNNSRGILLDSSSDNTLTNNTVKENNEYDVFISAFSDADCNNIVENNTGSGDRPVKYFNYSVGLQDEILSELILCNADNSNMNNVTIEGSATKKNNGLFVTRTDDSNFTNINSSNNYIGIYLSSSSNNTLTNNTISSNLDGIDLFYSSNNTIANNNASWNLWWGILLYSSNNNVIIDNNASKNIEAGILLFDSNGTNITNNRLSFDGWFGLLTFNSSASKLTYNDLSNNLVGIVLYESSNDTLMENTANLNEFVGIYLETSKNASITNNTARGNNISGFALYDSHNNLLLENDATLNSWEGIILFNSTSNELTRNNASSNAYFGIVIESSNQNILTNNTVESNYYFGILQYLSENNSINNTIYNLTEIIRGVRLYINEDVTPSLQAVDNSSNATYSLVIENLGIVQDTFVFNISNPDNSSTAYLNVQNISLNPGQKANLTLYVGDAQPGGYSVSVEAVSLDDENVSDSTDTLTIVYGASQSSSSLSSLAVKDSAIGKSGIHGMENLIEQETFDFKVSNPDDRLHLKGTFRSLTGDYRDMAGDYKVRGKSEAPLALQKDLDIKSYHSKTCESSLTQELASLDKVQKAISKMGEIMPSRPSTTAQAASQSNQNAFGSTSALINSNWTNSNFSYSVVKDSVINDSTIIKSMIFNSTVVNSSLSGVMLENALIIDNSIIHGNITLKGITYSPYNFSISNILLGYDKRKSDLVGMTQANKTLEVDAPNSNVSLDISTAKDYFAASLEVQKSGIQPIEVSNQTDNVGGYINVEASKNLKQGAGWIYIKVYYNESQLGNIDVNTLRLHFYNTSSQAWEEIPDSGVNRTANYVWANTTHFSVFGVKGSIVTAPPAPGGGAAAVIPYPLKLTFTTLTSSVMNDILQQLGLIYKQFYKMPITLAATMIMLDEYPKPSDISAIFLGKPVKSLEGDVYEIAATNVLDKYFITNTMIIARGDIAVDSMAAIAYAKSNHLPILLTKPGELPSATLEAAQRLVKPSKIIIIGGPVAVSSEVEAELEEIASVERIWGATRYETAIELANKIEDFDYIVISSGYNSTSDAVITAAGYKAPLIYVSLTEVPQTVKEYLKQHKGAKIVYDSTVSDSVKAEIKGLME